MATKRKPKNSGNSGPRLVRQDHGGALLSSGVKGNRGGSGRPSKTIREETAAVREKCRELFSERLEILEGIADNTQTKDADRIRALEILARFGGVDKIALTVDELPAEAATPERAARLWEQLERVKNVTELERLMVSCAKKQLGGEE